MISCFKGQPFSIESQIYFYSPKYIYIYIYIISLCVIENSSNMVQFKE